MLKTRPSAIIHIPTRMVKLLIARLSLTHFQIRESHQFPGIHVRHGPEFESIAIPMQNIITVLGKTLHGFSATGFRGRDEQIDNMLVAVVDERRYFQS